MSNVGYQRDEEFGHPWCLVWAPAIVGIVFLGIGIEALTDSRPRSEFVRAFWVVWTVGLAFGLVHVLRSLPETRFRVRVTNEGIERLRPNPILKARWNEIAGAETTAQSLKLTVAGGGIVIPRTVPGYMDLYKVISDRVPPSVLHPTSGLPLLLHYQSFNIASFVLNAGGLAGWCVLVSILYQAGNIPPLWYGGSLAFLLLIGLQEFYRRSKQYEFHADRIVARSAIQSKEYLKSDLKDGYLDEGYGHDGETKAVVLRLVFTNGDSLELLGGNISAEELYKVLKAHYSLI